MILRALRPISFKGMHLKGDIFELADFEAKMLIDKGFCEEVKQDHKHIETKEEPEPVEKKVIKKAVVKKTTKKKK